MADDFAERYGDLLTGSYDCVDRVVLNAYYPLGHSPGGFRCWWRRLHGGSDDQLDDTHLMRMAGRFARRVKAWASADGVPVLFCTAGQRKHLMAGCSTLNRKTAPADASSQQVRETKIEANAGLTLFAFLCITSMD